MLLFSIVFSLVIPFYTLEELYSRLCCYCRRSLCHPLVRSVILFNIGEMSLLDTSNSLSIEDGEGSCAQPLLFEDALLNAQFFIKEVKKLSSIVNHPLLGGARSREVVL